jgi:hypothetical protein
VSPEITKPHNSLEIIGVLAHELVHATVGNDAKHGKLFKRCALAVGLAGKMTATHNGEQLRKWALAFVTKHGGIPAGALNYGKGRKVQTTRLRKCVCAECGYLARVTSKWLDDAGAPICPSDGEPLECV